MSNTMEIIDILKNFDLEDEFSYEKLLLLIELIKLKLPTLIQSIQKGTMVFRSRENFDTNVFKQFKDIGCPTKEFVTKFNRANRPYQSIFYCSDKRETSYSEFMDEWRVFPVGKVFSITIGLWELLTDIKVHLFIDRKIIGDKFDLLKGKEWNEEEILLYDFIVEMFAKSAHNNKSIYILTSAISNSLLMRGELDGIMFPCVPTNGEGLNLALKSELFFNANLLLKHVTRDTFLTVRNENNIKADHNNIASMDGVLDYDNKLIIWK